ncbi:MbtH protein [Streptomyces capoamus]|uniref:MbtH protein n=1 Tax=Streptomyces capoamus TaxID=68183 RepID=A0A919EUZ2_9ACTN|nr:MbtH family NRPS accessory protein [Streptomyces capoamus]GGW16154.1 MbtH protein [Streptomyces libani subsp. rufus]GHG42162.1 MbtH protein [Streptomyces capoamus]
MAEEAVDTRSYLVVLNDEEQYSIWLADRELPLGWRSEGTHGSREECLAHIGTVWTDMRPLSLRLRMDGVAAGGTRATL